MIVKKYLVNTIEEVEVLIHKELGPTAVILSSRQIRYKGLKSLFFSNKVEVVAAVEENEMQNYKQFEVKNSESKTKAPLTQDVPREWESSIKTLAEDENKDPLSAEGGLTEPPVYEASTIPGTYLDPRFNRKQAQLAESALVNVFVRTEREEQSPSQNQQVINLKKLSASLTEHFGIMATPKPSIPETKREASLNELASEFADKEVLSEFFATKKHHDIIFYLLSCGLSHHNASLVLEKLRERYGHSVFEEKQIDLTLRDLLRKEISNLIPISGPICLTKGAVTKVALIGLSGTGKTTALMSIAAQYLDEVERKVAVISYCPGKMGGEEQISRLCTQFSLPFSLASTGDQLKGAIEENADADLILIDTPGFGFLQNPDINPVVQDFEAIENLQAYIVIGANTKDKDAIHLTRILSNFELKSLIFTKLDETQSLGLLLNVSKQAEIGISYIMQGPNVPLDLHIADPDELARHILKEPNND